MRFLISAIGLAALSGCMTIKPTQPALAVVDYPSLNTETTVNIGDTVVKKGRRYTYDGLQLITPLSKPAGITIGYEIPAQKLAATYEDKKFVYFQARRMMQKDLLMGTSPAASGGLCISKKNPEKIMIFFEAGTCVLSAGDNVTIEPTQVVAETGPGFVQELIYNGRVGDSVKFLYREFSQDIVRPAFTQEVQYDLSTDPIIGFKNVRIEVIRADNREITFKVLESFPFYE